MRYCGRRNEYPEDATEPGYALDWWAIIGAGAFKGE